MRIISGKYRNKKIYFPKNLKTRPIKDSVRENIFNILKHSKKIKVKVENSNIMDLYAGTGSFGLECLSREASKVFFVEKDKEAIIYLKKNIKNLVLENKSIIFDEDIAIILDNGSWLIKAAYSGGDTPEVFPNVLGTPKNSLLVEPKDPYIGDHATIRRVLLKLTRPVKNGQITDWKKMQDIWNYGIH